MSDDPEDAKLHLPDWLRDSPANPPVSDQSKQRSDSGPSGSDSWEEPPPRRTEPFDPDGILSDDDLPEWLRSPIHTNETLAEDHVELPDSGHKEPQTVESTPHHQSATARPASQTPVESSLIGDSPVNAHEEVEVPFVWLVILGAFVLAVIVGAILIVI